MTFLPRLLSIATGVPWWAWALAALLAWGGWHRYRAIDAREAFAAATTQAQKERAADETRQAQEHARRVQSIQEASDAATLQAQADRAARTAADAAAGRLQQRVAALQAGARSADPATAGQCQAASAATDLLADVQRRLDAAAGEFAIHADESRTAAQACERSYDALTPR